MDSVNPKLPLLAQAMLSNCRLGNRPASSAGSGSFKRRGFVSDMDKTECFSPEIAGRLCLGTPWKASLPRALFNAVLTATLSLFVAGCFTTEPTSQPPSPSNSGNTGNPANTAATQPSAGATTKDRNEVVTPMKQPDKPGGSTRPHSEPLTPAKPNPAPAKSAPMILAKKAPAPLAPVSVRERESTTPAPTATAASVAPPPATEIPGALIFKGDKNASKEYYARNARGIFGWSAFKWFAAAILLAVVAYAICPPLRVRITIIKDNLTRRFVVSRKLSGRLASKWRSRGKLKVKGAVTLAPATPFGDDTRRDQK
jgi:hypothetical protein